MSVTDTYLQIKKTALRHLDGTPTDGLVHRGMSYHVDFPAEDKDNLLVQVLHLKVPMTHDKMELIGAFQKRYGLDTEASAQLILTLGIVQLIKLMDSPLVEPPPPTEEEIARAQAAQRAAIQAKLDQMQKQFEAERAALEAQLQ